MWRNIANFSVYLLVRVLIAVIQALPLSACETVAELLATLFGRVLRVRGHVVDKNLRIAFPSMTAQEREKLKARVRARLPPDAMGRVTHRARANAVKGRVLA